MLREFGRKSNEKKDFGQKFLASSNRNYKCINQLENKVVICYNSIVECRGFQNCFDCDAKTQGIIMKQRGFTLIEVITSITLMLVVVNAGFVLFAGAIRMNQTIIAQKQLMEIGEFLENSLITEFSRAERIDSILSKDGTIYSNVGTEGIDVRAIKLIRSKHTNYSQPYREELIFLKDFEIDYRRSMWIAKNSNEFKTMDVKRYFSYSGYEVGTWVEALKIFRISDKIYRIELGLLYAETNINYSKSFLVKLQD